MVWAKYFVAGGAITVASAGLWFHFSSARPDPDLLSAREEKEAAEGAAQFVGSDACAGCHEVEHAAWRGSHHDLAMQPANARTVLGDFAKVKLVEASVTSTFFTRKSDPSETQDAFAGNEELAAKLQKRLKEARDRGFPRPGAN